MEFGSIKLPLDYKAPTFKGWTHRRRPYLFSRLKLIYYDQVVGRQGNVGLRMCAIAAFDTVRSFCEIRPATANKKMFVDLERGTLITTKSSLGQMHRISSLVIFSIFTLLFLYWK